MTVGSQYDRRSYWQEPTLWATTRSVFLWASAVLLGLIPTLLVLLLFRNSKR